MNLILGRLQNAYSFTDMEVNLIRYGIKAFVGEISKCLIMYLYFFALGQAVEYLIGLTLLLLLRRNLGGLHLKHYWSCLLLSFLFMNISVLLLPQLAAPDKPEMCLVLLLCLIINLQIGPVHAKLQKLHDQLLIKRSRIQASYIVAVYMGLVILFPNSRYIAIGFWVILLQTIQLFIAKYKGVKSYE